MEINDENDRELLLAKLYELNNPTANVPEMDLISKFLSLLTLVDTIGTCQNQSSHLVYLNICIK